MSHANENDFEQMKGKEEDVNPLKNEKQFSKIQYISQKMLDSSFLFSNPRSLTDIFETKNTFIQM